MTTITAREAHERFGEVIDKARREPVTITKHNRPSVVVVSSERYAELEALEDRVWLAMAKEAEQGELLSAEESMALLREKMNAGD